MRKKQLELASKKRIEVYLEPEDYEAVKEAANSRGLLLASWIRMTLRDVLRKEDKGR